MAASRWDAIVIGAGAAGLVCAIEAGKRGRRVLVVEHNAQIGRKILISGGGRCNFTNIHCAPGNFLSANPHFAKSALARYTPRDFVALVERHRIPYHEKTLGQLFCDRSARDIVDMLARECDSAGVFIESGCAVHRMAQDDGFRVETSAGTLHAESLAVATGGLSVSKMGATPFGYGIARQFGHALVDCRPALVPLTFSRDDLSRFGGLAGVSVDVVAGGFRERMLFTHRGLSGPAILQASSYWRPGQSIEIDLLPGVDLTAALRTRRSLGPVLAEHLPKRLADRMVEVHGGAKPGVALSDREIDSLTTQLCRWQFRPAGTEGYEKAEVTAGGVDTAEISSKTFESKRAPGLFFIGEVLDVTGHLGGFNFQWAWASAYSAGQYA
ncbi:MAG TPA: NAD(P)/FAD-dependent oxidoreductase [Candidatus Sulfopaludibacter sp.]|nr:NAD(P)/FAD-dependent oxidoreductase [Candidatus Sulfopaludibacter sp.]